MRMRPSASTTSAASRLSTVRPCLRVRYPVPPPSVRPAIPVVDTMPAGTASPYTCVAWSTSPCARADANGAGGGIDVHAFHHRHVDHQPVVDTTKARPVVAASADPDPEIVLPFKIARSAN